MNSCRDKIHVDEAPEFVKQSTVYREFLAEREEILKHKWYESEKAGCDVGFERALLDWIVKHRATWRRQRKTSAKQVPQTVQ